MTLPLLNSNLLRACGQVAAMVLSYLALGHAALVLAIAPGFATAIFPPVGVAVALTLLWGYRILPAVWLGSFLLNLSTAPALQWWIPCGIACSTSLTVALAVFLVRRYASFHPALTFERSILGLVVLAGPVSCLLSASLSTLLLLYTGQISAGQLSITWLTWWIGDALGVTLFVPLVFVLLAKPRSIWQPRMLNLGLPLLISMLLVTALFSRVQQQHLDNTQQQFFEQAKQVSSSFQFRVSKVLQQMQALSSLLTLNPQLTQQQFSQFLAEYNWSESGVLSFDYLQWLRQDQLHQLPASIVLRHFSADASQPYAAVIRLTATITGDTTRIGLNMWSESQRREAMDYAVISGQVSMTTPVQLLTGEPAALIFIPIFKAGRPLHTPEQRWQQLSGFICGVFRTDLLVDASLKQFDTDNFHLTIKELASHLSYHNQPATLPAYARYLDWNQIWSFAGRSVELRLQPSQHFLDRHSGMHSWYVLAGGLVLCSLLGVFLLILTGRSARTEHLIAQRTKELSSILDNANESIIIVDHQGLIERVNKETSALFGYPAAELLKAPVSKLLATLPEHNDHQLLQPLRLEQLQQWVGQMHELTGLHQNGNQLPLELGLSRVDLADKHLFTLMLHDLRERKKVERMKNDFISTVSHELRTPLTSIKGSLGLLAGGVTGTLPPQAAQLVQIAKLNTDRLTRLVNDILDIEKLEFGQLKLQTTAVDISELMREALQQNQAYADQYQVQLSLKTGPELHRSHLYLDKFRLLQVLSNLISNAVKFSPSHATVWLSYQRAGQGIEIRVQDKGCGIAESFRSKIFDKFAQADSSDSRSNQGSGLGLNISKTLVEMMQGRIDFESEIGVGTTFILWFPLYPQAQT
ncbi:ATP-binding protein [Rheinheimera sp.]|uniref:ATP-binding protein n=1 Tax=Rheinheimera sp. TaxID=1869214 RepID=UPI00307F26C0